MRVALFDATLKELAGEGDIDEDAVSEEGAVAENRLEQSAPGRVPGDAGRVERKLPLAARRGSLGPMLEPDERTGWICRLG